MSTHLWDRHVNRTMWYSTPVALGMAMTPHQKPSLNQSLLSGFDVVGWPLVPAG